MALWSVRLVHTLAWALFVAAIFAIPILAVYDQLTWALVLSALVWGEVAVLYVNDLRCPLTGVAERYTDRRAANFDIFLPLWLARNNKQIFGPLFAAAELFLLLQWAA